MALYYYLVLVYSPDGAAARLHGLPDDDGELTGELVVHVQLDVLVALRLLAREEAFSVAKGQRSGHEY